MTAGPTSTVVRQTRATRMTERIARWEREARGVEAWWVGGLAYKKFCGDLARAARDDMAALKTTCAILTTGPELAPDRFAVSD